MVKPKSKPLAGLRITVTMEARTPQMMDWALLQAIKFAQERWIGVSVSHKDDPTAKVSCRTTKLRKLKSTNGLPK